MTALVRDPEDRVLVLMPTSQDAARTCELLSEAGLRGTPCADVQMLCREFKAGAGLLLLADEAFRGGGAQCLSAAMAEQPPGPTFHSWS